MSLDVSLRIPGTEQVWAGNITHNLGAMAEAAGLYQALWRPEDIGCTTAQDLAPFLRRGLAVLTAAPRRFKVFNPVNGWGNYEGLVSLTRDYLRACEEYPHARLRASR